MSGRPKRRIGEGSTVDSEASSVCSKSGALAIAISVTLLCLIPYWQHHPAEKALANYVSSRVLLNMTLDQLDQDPAWQYYKDLHQDAESTSLNRMPKTFTYPPPQWHPRSEDSQPPKTSQDWKPSSDSATADIRKPKPVALRVSLKFLKPRDEEAALIQIPPPSNSPNAPAPPTGLTATVVGPIVELNSVTTLASKLDDSEQLTSASNYSNYYAFSIARWVQKKRMLAWQNQLQNRCQPKEIDLPSTGDAPSEPDPEVLFDCLTIRDWRELAAYEMPSTGSPDQNQLGGSIGKEVDVSVGALPHRGDLASFMAAAALILTLVYFGAFLREATHSEHFPAAATLFSAFSRSASTNLLMLLALFFPFLSTLAVAFISKSWVLYVELFLTGMAVYWVFRGFQQKSYFRSAFQILKLSRAQKDKGVSAGTS